MTIKEREKAIDALKVSIPIISVTPEEFQDYFHTIHNIMDWLEQLPTDDLKRMLDEFEEEHATVCDEDGRRFKVVIDGLLYYADEPKVKTIHGKTGEVVIGGFYREERE